MRTTPEHTFTRQIARQMVREDAERMAKAAKRPVRDWREFLPAAQERFDRIQAQAQKAERARRAGPR